MTPDKLDHGQERRFFTKVRMTDHCWEWTAAKVRGYGVFSLTHRSQARAARVSYVFFYGSLSDDLDVDHLCRNPGCVRPDHLEAVTREENLRRKYAAQTHCKRGHPLSGDNLYPRTERSPQRQCKTCKRDAGYRRGTRATS